jgi:hypothetical protein
MTRSTRADLDYNFETLISAIQEGKKATGAKKQDATSITLRQVFARQSQD